MKHHERVALFHERLKKVIDDSGINQSRFAASIGVDRSTLSQLLSPDNIRLPRADTLAAISENHQISIDWLLVMTQEGYAGADILPGPLEFESFDDSDIFDLFIEWHREASHYKVRYIPATLPDLLKTDAIAAYEYSSYGSGRTDQAIRSTKLLLSQQQQPEKEMEVCQSWQSLRSFALGEGIWQGLSVKNRRGQLRHMVRLIEELYPGFRLFLYDGLKAYTVPFTVYGPLRSVVFLGQLYLVFNNIEDIRKLSTRFDNLIRVATVQANEVSKSLEDLLAEIS